MFIVGMTNKLHWGGGGGGVKLGEHENDSASLI